MSCKSLPPLTIFYVAAKMKKIESEEVEKAHKILLSLSAKNTKWLEDLLVFNKVRTS